MNIKKLFLVHHAHCYGKDEGFGGDPPLSPRGRIQAVALANEVKKLLYENKGGFLPSPKKGLNIWSSPRKGASQTAKLLKASCGGAKNTPGGLLSHFKELGECDECWLFHKLNRANEEALAIVGDKQLISTALSVLGCEKHYIEHAQAIVLAGERELVISHQNSPAV